MISPNSQWPTCMQGMPYHETVASGRRFQRDPHFLATNLLLCVSLKIMSSKEASDVKTLPASLGLKTMPHSIYILKYSHEARQWKLSLTLAFQRSVQSAGLCQSSVWPMFLSLFPRWPSHLVCISVISMEKKRKEKVSWFESPAPPYNMYRWAGHMVKMLRKD